MEPAARHELAAGEPALRADPADRADLRRRRGGTGDLVIFAVLVAAAVVAWYKWPVQETPPAPAPRVAQPAPAVTGTPAPQPAILHPVEASNEPIAERDLGAALGALLGPGAVGKLLDLGDFPRRLVATVDNLGREVAPPSAWPAHTTPGRFDVEGGAISPANAARYQPWVDLAQALDARSAVQVYRRMYPLLQQAYVQLGFGDRYFNDRLVQVLDLLIATPEPTGPVQVRLTEVKGPVPSEQPWTRYEFADARLQSLAAGQKILLRLAPEQRRVVREKLAAVRRELLR